MRDADSQFGPPRRTSELGEPAAAARSGLIAIGGGDDAVSRIQLAARWAEAYAPHQGDSLAGALNRFRVAYEYLDSVTHGVEPAALDGSEAR